VFALRYQCELFTGVCYRIALAKWRIELGEKIPTHRKQPAPPVREIMRDVNRAFEVAVPPRPGQLVLGPSPLERLT